MESHSLFPITSDRLIFQLYDISAILPAFVAIKYSTICPWEQNFNMILFNRKLNRQT